MNTINTLFKRHSRFFRFALVGSSGIVVNNGILWLLVSLVGLPFYFCSFIAIEASIITNFLLNDTWTWSDRRQSPFYLRFFRYNSSTAFSSIFINIAVLLFLK